MKPEDIPSDYEGDSTETVQLSLPEWANALLTDYSEQIYGNNQHKGEFVANALILMHKIQQGEGVTPEDLAMMGVDVSRAGWGQSFGDKSGKRMFSTDEEYLNNLELSHADELTIEEFDYDDLCSDTYAKRIPAIASVIRGQDTNYTTSGLRTVAKEMFTEKHRKTINRYIDELEDAIQAGEVADLHQSVIHFYESLDCENGDFGTEAGESFEEALLTEYSEESLEEHFYSIHPHVVTGGMDGFVSHAIDFADELVDELARLEAEIEGEIFTGADTRRAFLVFTLLRELPEMVEAYLIDREYEDVEGTVERLTVRVDEGADYIEDIRKHREDD